MDIQVNLSVTARLPEGGMVLYDLVQIVAAAEAAGLEEGAKVTIDYQRGHQLDRGYMTIRVTAQ